jgi:quercetin dioxygenase-like cupin family protein
MPDYFLTPSDLRRFDADRFAKLDVVRGTQLFLGLNCFEPGQSQEVHRHAGADKFYLVLSGNARMLVGTEARDAGAGTLVWAPQGVPHGVERAHDRSVLLVGMSPPPQSAR